MFFNYWIGFVKETYIFLGVCCTLNFYYFRFDTAGNTFNSLTALFWAAVLLLFPLFVSVLYSKKANYHLILAEDRNFTSSYGHAIEGLNIIKQGRSVILLLVFSLFRSLALIGIVVFMQERPILSIFIVNYSSLIIITVTGYVRPYTDNVQNNMQYFNEFILLLLTYH
jgi:hypothetical protein